ncbi:transketolase family protein [Candidatus Woesearchaeota archaeon]|nr:transketolase family protein [Candidatus Woesearchaeota archaeon]
MTQKLEASREGYGRGLVKAAKKHKDVVSLEADLGKSTKSRMLIPEFPERWISCGITEQNMIVTAAGLAWSGKIPFASTFAIFSERAFEQIRNAVARPKMNVKVIGSHAGLVTGTDGASAQAIEDMAIYRSLPNMVVICPADSMEAEKATLALAEYDGPAYMRLTRDKTPILFDDNHKFEIGKAIILKEGKDLSVVACGPLIPIALEAAELLKKEDIDAEVINMSTIKPLDKDTLLRSAKKTGKVITAEDHNIIGGLGGAVAEVLAENSDAKLARIGVQDTFAESGAPKDLYEKYGLTAENIVRTAKKL